jgi:hypothetical protein
VKAFLTGSRAYGTPRPDSDVDLVVCVSKDEAAKLRELSDDPDARSVRFGRLNLVICTDRKLWDAWALGTDELKARAPVTRDEAKRVLSHYRQLAGAAARVY